MRYNGESVGRSHQIINPVNTGQDLKKKKDFKAINEY